METKNLLRLAFVAIAILLVGCKNQPEPITPPDEPVVADDFKIEVLSTTSTSVNFRITPNDPEMRYIAMITPKSNFDAFESDEDYINDDMLWFESIMYQEGLTIEEFFERELKSGITEDTQGNLSPSTEYYVYAYGVNIHGLVQTDLYKVAFTTEAVEIEKIKFEISVSEVGYNNAKISVVPEKNDTIYFVNVFSDADFAKWGGDEDAYAEQLAYVRNYYLSMGASTEQMIANLCFAGSREITIEQLQPGTHYTAYAIAVNKDFIAISAASTAEFETLTVANVDLTFECDITDVQYDRVFGTLTPSNNEDTYICSVQYAEAAEWYGSDEEFIETIVMDIDMWHGGVENALHQGPISLENIGGLAANTDYIIVCFGYSGAPTTPLFTFPFTTPEASGNPEDLTIELTIEEVTHNSVRVTTNPSVGAYYFASYIDTASFNEAVEEFGSTDLAVAHFANIDIDYGAEFLGGSRAMYLSEMGAILGKYTSYFNQLQPSTEYIAFAIAVDMETGELASSRGFLSEPFTTTQKVVSSAKVEFTFGNYYDGSELAELDPAQYLNCSGYAVLPYTITPNDDAMTWYTGFYNGDYTDWGCTDEDIYAELITYGYEFGSNMVSVDRYEGIAVLSYDEPFTFLGIAQDWEESYGAGTIEVVTLTRDGVSPAEEFLASKQQSTMAKAAKSAVRR